MSPFVNRKCAVVWFRPKSLMSYLEVTLVFLPEVDSRKGESSCSLQNVCLERTSKRGMKGMRFYENFWKITPR